MQAYHTFIQPYKHIFMYKFMYECTNKLEDRIPPIMAANRARACACGVCSHVRVCVPLSLSLSLSLCVCLCVCVCVRVNVVSVCVRARAYVRACVCSEGGKEGVSERIASKKASTIQ